MPRQARALAGEHLRLVCMVQLQRFCCALHCSVNSYSRSLGTVKLQLEMASPGAFRRWRCLDGRTLMPWPLPLAALEQGQVEPARSSKIARNQRRWTSVSEILFPRSSEKWCMVARHRNPVGSRLPQSASQQRCLTARQAAESDRRVLWRCSLCIQYVYRLQG